MSAKKPESEEHASAPRTRQQWPHIAWQSRQWRVSEEGEHPPDIVTALKDNDARVKATGTEYRRFLTQDDCGDLRQLLILTRRPLAALRPDDSNPASAATAASDQARPFAYQHLAADQIEALETGRTLPTSKERQRIVERDGLNLALNAAIWVWSINAVLQLVLLVKTIIAKWQ